MGEKIKIIIADDSLQFVKGILYLLGKHPEYEVIGVASQGEELLHNPHLRYADIVLLDIEMPVKNGFETARAINWEMPDKKMIACTMYHDKVYLEQLILAGFRGFINKAEISEKLHDVISSVLNNSFHFPENITTVH